MKKIYLLAFLLTLMLTKTSTFAQNVSFEIYASYARSLYALSDVHEGQCGFLPVGFLLNRVIDEDKLYVGFEGRINLIKPAFALKHPLDGTKAYTNKFCGQYFDFFGKYYVADLPLFGMAGLGVFINNHLRTVYEQAYFDSEPWLKQDHKTKENTSYKMSFAFNIGLGVSLGQERKVDILVRYFHHKNKLAGDENDLGYAAGDISLGVGYRF